MVVLKRLADARKDGDRIYAIISGIGSSSDGLGTSMLAPSPDGEALAMERAYQMAAVSPKDVELLEAHGTGTPSGDVVELQAIEKVFGTSDNAWCALGSVKSMIGHCQAASGIAGLIKTALSLYHRILPPTLHVDNPTRQIDWLTSPCYINSEARTWIHPKIHPGAKATAEETNDPAEQDSLRQITPLRKAAVSAFGFGGINAHAVLEEHDDASESERPSLIRDWETELCLFSGHNRHELTESLRAVAAFIERTNDAPLRDIAFTLAKKLRDDLQDRKVERLAIVAYSASDLLFKVERVVAALEANEDELPITDVYFNSKRPEESGKLAFVLPGLGAAYPNMLAELCYNFPDVRAVFDYVDHLAASSNCELLPSKKVFPRPKGPVTETAASLAAMDSAVVTVLMAEWALFTVLQKLGIQPDALLGCSTGEFAALTMSGAVDIVAAAPMFFRLSTAVSRSVPKEGLAQLRSAMVLGDYELMEEALTGIEGLYVGAALSPSQTMISGSKEALALALKALSDVGFESHILPMAIPYHTPLVSGFIDQENADLQELPLCVPTTPAWSCSKVGLYPSDLAAMRRITTELFTQPIMLKKTIEAMYADGIRKFVEVGPKGVLTGLIDDILADRPHLAVASNYAQGSAITQLNQCLAVLAAHGIAMDLDYLFTRRSPALLDFTAGPKRVRSAVKLNLRYPELTLSCDIVAAIQELQPLTDRYPPGSAQEHGAPLEYDEHDAYEPSPSRHPEPADSVLQTYLNGMAEFHHNLMNMQEEVMQAYLSQKHEYEQGVTAERERGSGLDLGLEPEQVLSSFPLLSTGMLSYARHTDSAEVEVTLNLDTHRYLLDHAIGGAVTVAGAEPERVYLLPLTVALEMMSELASLLIPDLKLVKLSEVRAFKRIRVSTEGCRLKVRASIDGPGIVSTSIEVLDANWEPSTGSASMQCQVHFSDHYGEPTRLHLPEHKARAARLTAPELYSDQGMFHGPRMQSVLELTYTSHKVTAATVSARPASEWFPATDAPHFIIDPLLLDNATQPVLFHLFEHNEDVSALLPFLVDSLEFYTDLNTWRGKTGVYAHMQSLTSRGTEADVFIVDERNCVLAKFTSITAAASFSRPTGRGLSATRHKRT